MPRLAKIELETAEGESKELLQGIQNNLGKIPNIFKGMANSPAAFNFYLSGSGALSSGSLSGKEREAVALVVAETNSCEYCKAAHTAIGSGEGISSEEALELRSGKSGDDKLAALVVFAKKVMETKGNVSDADISDFKSSGYGDAEIAEVVGLVALNVFTNFFNHVNDTEVDFPKV